MERILAARRVLYLSQWFPPENGPVGLQVARGLIERGYEVEVLTGFPNYPSGKLAPGYRLAPYRREVIGGVEVHRVFLYPSHDRSSFGRALNYLSFFVSASTFCIFNLRRFDVVYVYHPPITSGLAAAIGGFFARRPFILEVQDLWPDSVVASGMSGTSALGRILEPVCRFVYRRAALVLGQSAGMATRLAERGAKTGVIFNWANEASARPNGLYDIDSLGFQGRFNFVYAGNFGTLQALEVLVEAAGLVASEAPEIQLTLIGEGAERDRLEELVRNLGATNVRLLPAVPQSHIGDVLTAADVLVTHLRDDPLFEVTIPSKTQFYLAMGKPVLVGVRGEAARIVVDAGAGVAAEPENPAAIAEAFIRLARTPRHQLDDMGAEARAAYDERFSYAGTMSRIAGYISQVLTPPENVEIRRGSSDKPESDGSA